MDDPLRQAVLLTLQVALLGEVSPQLRAVVCSWGNADIHVRAVFDGEIKNDDWESMNDVEAEVIASFPKHKVHLECVRRDAPESLRDLWLMAMVYRRRESSSSDSSGSEISG